MGKLTVKLWMRPNLATVLISASFSRLKIKNKRFWILIFKDIGRKCARVLFVCFGCKTFTLSEKQKLWQLEIICRQLAELIA
jgi:hypothetical protein